MKAPPVVREFLTPVRETGPRPGPDAQKEASWYVRSFLWMRLMIGILGVVMPLWLVFEDKLAFDGDPAPGIRAGCGQ